MSLYRLSKDKLEPVRPTTFVEERLLERKDLQRLLKGDITVIGDDLMVLAEEFGEWEESNRRVDLLCLDKQGARAGTARLAPSLSFASRARPRAGREVLASVVLRLA